MKKPLLIRLNELKEERQKLVERKQDLVLQLQELNIPHNLAYKLNTGNVSDEKILQIGEEKIALRNVLTKESVEIERRLTAINNEIKELNIEKDKNDTIHLKKILTEILSQSQLDLIYEEVDSRLLDMPPKKVSIGIDNSINQKQLAEKYRQLAKESIDKLINARKSVTKVIDEGMKKFDKGYFLQVVSPLNKELPTISELDKLKRTNHL